MNLAKVGLGALNAAQYKLNTSAHNVNNAATEGYNRQSVRQQSAGAQVTGAGYIGRGVETVTVERSYDNFLYKQLVSARGQGAALSSYSNEIRQLDTLFADRTVGIAPGIENFFKSVNAVASNPADPAAREEMLGQANNLATQIRQTNDFLSKQAGNINTQITTTVDQINSYVERIRDANTQIVKARASASQHEPNDLLDQRDKLLAELNELVGVTVFEQDGRVNLAIGNGQMLLGGDTVYTLRAQPSSADPQRVVVAVEAPGPDGKIIGVEVNESSISGGKLGGLVQYRRETLDDVRNNLGRLAVGLAEAFNEVHASGYDLVGDAGGNFFTYTQPSPIPSVKDQSNAAAVSIQITDGKALTADDYQVKVTSKTATGVEYSITNLATKEVKTITIPATPENEMTFEGVEFTFDPAKSPDVGDSWLVQPTRYAAASLQVAITDPSKIAAAGQGVDPVTGDPVALGPSDGTVALKLAQLQVDKTLNNGTMSITESFSQIVNRVGVASQQVSTANKAQQTLIQQTYAAQQEVSGVNLNEEYVNIQQYLEQFRAASKLVEVAGTLFDTLLNMR